MELNPVFSVRVLTVDVFGDVLSEQYNKSLESVALCICRLLFAILEIFLTTDSNAPSVLP
jgi:TRAP-type C4-dicarboxylate transport system permease small subunit